MKSFTAHKINELEESGPLWERGSLDRLIRSESDLQEKFNYITRNPWDSGVADQIQDYRGYGIHRKKHLGQRPGWARQRRALPGRLRQCAI